MTTLAELKAAAEKANRTVVGSQMWPQIVDLRAHGFGPTDSAYLELCSPDTILALVACAEAAQHVWDTVPAEYGPSEQTEIHARALVMMHAALAALAAQAPPA